MDFYFSIYSVTLLTGFAHGWLFGLLFLIRGQTMQHIPSKLLGLLMILLAQSLMLYMLGFGGIEIFWKELTFFPTSVAFLIGPTVWFYTRFLLDARVRFKAPDIWHLLPFAIEFCYHLSVFVQGERYARWHDEHIYIGSNVYLVRDTAVLVSQGIYLLFARRAYRRYLKWAQVEYADAGMAERKWLGRFLTAMLVRWVVLVIVGLADFVYDLNFEHDWWDNVFTCLVIYYLGLSAWGQSTIRHSHYTEASEYIGPDTPADASVQTQTEVKPSDQAFSRLEALMQNQRPWLDPELTLTALAEQADMSPKALSALIARSGMNFNLYVNQYRVEQVVRLANDPDYRHLTIVGLAFEAGFNSKSTFNRTFKELKNQTPSDYIRSVRTG